MQETQVWSLGWEDPLEEEMTTHRSILTYRIPGTEEPGGSQSKGLQRVRHDWATKNKMKVMDTDMTLVYKTELNWGKKGEEVQLHFCKEPVPRPWGPDGLR